MSNQQQQQEQERIVTKLYNILENQFKLWFPTMPSKVTSTYKNIDTLYREVILYSYTMEKDPTKLTQLIKNRQKDYQYLKDNIRSCCKWR
jgi:hypothetical protein